MVADGPQEQLRQRRASPRDPVVVSYIALLTVVAGLLAWAGWAWYGAPAVTPFAVLALLGLVGTLIRERELGPHLGVSFTTVILAAAIPLTGPAGAVGVGYLSYAFFRKTRPRTQLFNAAMTGVMGGLGGLVYLLIGGAKGFGTLGAWELLTRVALPLVFAYALMTLVNALLIGGMSAAVGRGDFLPAARRVLRSVSWTYVSHVLVGFLFVVLWGPARLGVFSVVLILAPLFIVQWTLGRDAAERRSHERTVKTFVAALETSEPWSAGHSARVALLCDRIGARLGLGVDEAEALHYAALLHDIGLVAVPPDTDHRSAEMGTDYLAQIIGHPEAGVRMLEDITFLSAALPAIAHHHERLDGRGYPAGLAGGDIPRAARVIAVVDVFDSLTTTRHYREAVTDQEALAVCRERAGAHLDPDVVEALAEVLELHPWRPTLVDESVRSGAVGAPDHDDPMVSDRYAEWSPESEAAR